MAQQINAENQSSMNIKGNHNITLSSRKLMTLTGIEDVISFDEESVVMRSSLGMLTVDGGELHIVKLELDGGNVMIEGNINGIFYMDVSEKDLSKNGKLKRLFR